MDTMLLAYSILGGISMLAFGIFILKIAGLDMVFAIYRYFQPRGCDIFITNSNRHVDRHYLMAKDGTFTIENETYLTNPHKLEGLSDEMKKTIEEKLSLKRRNIENNIIKWHDKRKILIKQIETAETIKENLPILEDFKLQLAHIDEAIATLNAKIKDREQSYFMQRRACYFYIKGDPIPKDLWEWRTDLDTAQLDNIILRAQTKDPKGVDILSKDIVFIKRFILFTLIGVAVAIFLSVKNGSYIQQIGTHLGVVFKLG